MQFLIDDYSGNTIQANLVDVLYFDSFEVNGVPVQTVTARSLEAEAVKEAKELIGRLVGEDYCELNKEYPELKEWLAKWGRD